MSDDSGRYVFGPNEEIPGDAITPYRPWRFREDEEWDEDAYIWHSAPNFLELRHAADLFGDLYRNYPDQLANEALHDIPDDYSQEDKATLRDRERRLRGDYEEEVARLRTRFPGRKQPSDRDISPSSADNRDRLLAEIGMDRQEQADLQECLQSARSKRIQEMKVRSAGMQLDIFTRFFLPQIESGEWQLLAARRDSEEDYVVVPIEILRNVREVILDENQVVVSRGSYVDCRVCRPSAKPAANGLPEPPESLWPAADISDLKEAIWAYIRHYGKTPNTSEVVPYLKDAMRSRKKQVKDTVAKSVLADADFNEYRLGRGQKLKSPKKQ